MTVPAKAIMLLGLLFTIVVPLAFIEYGRYCHHFGAPPPLIFPAETPGITANEHKENVAPFLCWFPWWLCWALPLVC